MPSFPPHRSRFLLFPLFVVGFFLWNPASVLAQGTIRAAAPVDSQVTSPRAFLGFTPGDDRKLANYKQSWDYFHKIAGQTRRIRLYEVGKTAYGETMMLTVISSEANLKRLDRLKAIAHTLADGRVSESDAQALAAEGRPLVWIDGGLHATEVGSAQHTINLGYDLVAREDEEYRYIRDHVVVLLMPSINPDGQNLVADWFMTHVGTPQEGTPLPVLYQKYSGHDNNRDWYMLNLPETRNVTHLLYDEWYPQIVYNHHQAPGMFPERMFVPPYDDPMNPNIPPLVIRGVNAVGTAMHTRFEEENKSGIISLDTYTTWWNGGMRSAPCFHNVIGILTEVTHASPYSAEIKVRPDQAQPTNWYPHPYTGGTWHFADTVAYMNTGSVSLLRWAADTGQTILMDRWRMAHEAIRRGETEAPYGFVVPLDTPSQRDPNTAALFLERMRLSGLEVRIAAKPFAQGEKTYPAGTAVLLAAQPNRPHLIDMMTPQHHPTRTQGPGGPPIPPYDIAGWTLTYQMGVTAIPLTTRPNETVLSALPLITQPITLPAPLVTKAPEGGVYLLPAERNASFVAANRLLAAHLPVMRWTAAHTLAGKNWGAGTFVVPATDDSYRALAAIASDLRLPVTATAKPETVSSISLAAPRVGTYDPYGGAITQGWAQYVLETFQFPHTLITNPDIRQGKLKAQIDTLLLTTFPNVRTRNLTASGRNRREGGGAAPGADTTQTPDAPAPDTRRDGLGPGWLGGPAPKSLAPEVRARLEGIGTEGESNLRVFVEEGGTLVATDSAVAPVVTLFHLPIRNVTTGTKFYSPGSVFQVQIDPESPLGWGLPTDVNVYFDNGAAWEPTTLFPSVAGGGAFAMYPDANPLLSGWIIEDQVVRRKAAAVFYRVGKGRVIVYGFDVLFRGQPHMGFPLLFNALYPTAAGTE